MNIAIISDIHSNLEALIKAFDIIDKKSVNEIICLGDIIGYGANPNECVKLVQKHCSLVIKGNHEDALTNTNLVEHFTDDARAAIIWTRNQLTDDNTSFLQSLPLTGTRNNLLFVHASPCKPERWKYIIGTNVSADIFECFKESICFIGHTHIPGIYSVTEQTKDISKDDRYLINVGSIGQPRDGKPNLSFGIFDLDLWKYENVRELYDIETAMQKIFKTDLPQRLGGRLMLGI